MRGTDALDGGGRHQLGRQPDLREGEEAAARRVQLAHRLGNDVNAVNSMGLTAVHGAANRGADAIIAIWPEQGAALDVPDKEDAHRWCGHKACSSLPIRV